MRLKILVLFSVLLMGLPAVLFAQAGDENSTTVSAMPPYTGGCMIVSPGNSDIERLTNQLTCVYNQTRELNQKIANLESRIRALESTTIITTPGKTCPVGCECSGNVVKCKMIEPLTKPENSMKGSPLPALPGTSSEETKAIQGFLKEEGSFTYPTATGYYGTITKDAVRKFQAKQGLTATGMVDKATLEKMKALAPQIAPSASASVQQVQAPQ